MPCTQPRSSRGSIVPARRGSGALREGRRRSHQDLVAMRRWRPDCSPRSKSPPPDRRQRREEGAVVVGKILESRPHYGYNAQTNVFEDLVKAASSTNQGDPHGAAKRASIAASCSLPKPWFRNSEPGKPPQQAAATARHGRHVLELRVQRTALTRNGVLSRTPFFAARSETNATPFT